MPSFFSPPFNIGAYLIAPALVHIYFVIVNYEKDNYFDNWYKQHKDS